VLLLAFAAACSYTTNKPEQLTKHHTTESKPVTATNPIIYADVPDPSIVRVADTYYMSSTTMHMNPGVPVMKSQDLKNWSVVSYAHQAIDEHNEKLNLNANKNAYGKGSWASSITYKNGTFYLSTFSYTTGKTYLYQTQNIEGGEWSTHIIDDLYHDASLLLDDDGRNYIAFGHDEIHLVELNADVTGVKEGGLNTVIIPSASAVAGNDFILKAEGTQIQKINGWYYIHNICWPKNNVRTQVIHRSRNITGPYEGRVVLQHQGVAQGEFIDTIDGKWYALLFGDRGAVGRIPYLIPVKWENDWPLLGEDGKVPEQLDFKSVEIGLTGIIESDEFNNNYLSSLWQWNHNPYPPGWTLDQKSGVLRLTNKRIDKTLHTTRNTLTQRMFGPKSAATIALNVSHLRDGDTAGIAAFAHKYGFVGVRQDSGKRYLVMVTNEAEDHREVTRIPLTQDNVYLKVSGDFRSIDNDPFQRIDTAEFYFSLDGKSWRKIGNQLPMSYDLKHFMGYRFALFNFATKEAGGYADFDYFRVIE